MNQDLERIMITEEQIAGRVREVAVQLDKLYEGRRPVVVCILKGSVMFFSDLIRHMETPLELDFMAVSSYGCGTTSTGCLQVKKDLTTDIAGRDVLIVEDIIDSGNTLYNLKKLLNSRSPSSVNIVTLLDKPQRREVPMEPEYTCFVIEDEFVVGYGMDYAEEYRNLPYIGVLKRCVYEK
ncbi:MAG: hypoxanthine phosphoribosyltransferase [Christensenellaceae bacterium]|jgi:hypoxanthine phosphoribosyltransferase|nr:hypoxanthine phosphoribosyltransferase [Clostridia bacterium]PWM01966.1 MAG: hypoxanthine phosphoribosyltransferase [Clostridiales bacterium]